MYELMLTHEAQTFYERADASLARRLHRCFDRLRQNPYEHPNIKRLRGPWLDTCATEWVTGGSSTR